MVVGAIGCIAACGQVAAQQRSTEESRDAAEAEPDSGMPPVPVECAGTTPHLSTVCARTLREMCERHADEPSCAREQAFVFDQSILLFTCGWSKVVRFSDISTCAVESVRGRCDLYGALPMGCGDACAQVEAGGLYDSLVARVRDNELVKSPCFNGAAMVGPIGEWESRVDPENQDGAYRTCGGHEPPPPRELCDCRRAACAAQ